MSTKKSIVVTEVKVFFNRLAVGDFFKVVIPSVSDKSPIYQKIKEEFAEGIEGPSYNCKTTIKGKVVKTTFFGPTLCLKLLN